MMSNEAEMSTKWEVDVKLEIRGQMITIPVVVEDKKPMSARIARRMAEEYADVDIRLSTVAGTARDVK